MDVASTSTSDHRVPASTVGRRLMLGSAGGLVLVLAACGSSGQPQQSATSSASSGPSSSSVSAVPTGGSLTAAPGGSPTTVQGTVTEGVENGCVVLVDATGAAVANLQGWDMQAHPFGSQVEATGTFEPDLMTTCQQGTPFEATTVVSR